MSHLLSYQRFVRLKSNKHAYDHFLARQETYRRYSSKALALSKTVPEFAFWENLETRVEVVKQMILSMDQSVWGLQRNGMAADEIADSYARLVVGHET